MFANGNPYEKNDDPDKIPVLIEIKIKQNDQIFFLNSEELSAFPEEEEILLQDGAQYFVVSCNQLNQTIEMNGKLLEKELFNVVLEKKVDKYLQMNYLFRSIKLLID